MISTLDLFLRSRKRLVSVVLYGLTIMLPRLALGVLVILYTTVFSPREYGTYGLLSAVLAFFSVFVDLGLPSAILRNFYSDEKQALTYLSAAIYGARIVMLAALPLVGSALFLVWHFIGVGVSHAWLYIPLLLAIAYIDRTADILAAICRALEKPINFTMGRVVQTAAQIAAGYLLVFVFKIGVVGAYLAMLIGEISSWIFYEIVVVRRLGIKPARFNWPVMKACLTFGFPLVPTKVAGWGRQLALRPTLAHVVPMPSVGLYSFASSIAVIPTAFSSAVDLALSPLYFKRRAGDNSEVFNAKVFDFALIFLAVLLPVWVFLVLQI